MILFSAEKLNFSQPNPIFDLPAVSLSQEIPAVGSTSSYSDSASSTANNVEQQINGVDQQLKAAITTPSAQDMQNLNKTNARLQAQGKPPVDFAKVSNQVESIMNSSASPKEKKKQIEALRKQLGLSKGEMKKLFTNRIAGLYKKAAQTLKVLQTRLQSQLALAKTEAQQRYGAGSPQALEAQKSLDALNQQLTDKIKDYNQRAAAYKALYPSFWSRFVGFFKNLGKVLLHVVNIAAKVFKFIPGIGQAVAATLGPILDYADKLVNKGKSWLPKLPAPFNFFGL